MTRQQLRFCVPFGLATVLSMLSRNLGNVVIAKYIGVAALAQLTIGTYGEPIILALRNSISTVVLPELVRLGGRSPDDALRLWHRTVVINCLLLFPLAAIVAWYAEPLIVKAFGPSYRPAIPVLQWYAVVIVCACVDFSPLLRAINRTRAFVAASVVAALANGLTLVVLLPATGVVGAAVGLAVANFVATVYLGFSVSRLYGSGLRRLLPWTPVAKVAVCAAGGAVIAFGITFESRATLLGAVCGSLLYGAVFVVPVEGHPRRGGERPVAPAQDPGSRASWALNRSLRPLGCPSFPLVSLHGERRRVRHRLRGQALQDHAVAIVQGHGGDGLTVVDGGCLRSGEVLVARLQSDGLSAVAFGINE